MWLGAILTFEESNEGYMGILCPIFATFCKSEIILSWKVKK